MKLYEINLGYGVAVVIAASPKKVMETWAVSDYGYIRISFKQIKEIKGYTVDGEAKVIACYYE